MCVCFVCDRLPVHGTTCRDRCRGLDAVVVEEGENPKASALRGGAMMDPSMVQLWCRDAG